MQSIFQRKPQTNCRRPMDQNQGLTVSAKNVSILSQNLISCRSLGAHKTTPNPDVISSRCVDGVGITDFCGKNGYWNTLRHIQRQWHFVDWLGDTAILTAWLLLVMRKNAQKLAASPCVDINVLGNAMHISMTHAIFNFCWMKPLSVRWDHRSARVRLIPDGRRPPGPDYLGRRGMGMKLGEYERGISWAIMHFALCILHFIFLPRILHLPPYFLDISNDWCCISFI